MIRRQKLSDRKGYSQQLRPVKMPTARGYSIYLPTILYLRGTPYLERTGNTKWVGKIFIPWQGENLEAFLRKVQLGLAQQNIYLNEYFVARATYPNTYRILYSDPTGKFIKSKPSVEYVPSRLNLILHPTNNVVLAVKYF